MLEGNYNPTHLEGTMLVKSTSQFSYPHFQTNSHPGQKVACLKTRLIYFKQYSKL